jgi:hypothetical protein
MCSLTTEKNALPARGTSVAEQERKLNDLPTKEK